MQNLKEMLLKEQNRLEEILIRTESQLKDAPQGTMRLSSSKNQVQYYHCMPGEKDNGRYISKTKEQMIRRLAQKSYDERVVKLAEKRLAQIRRITKDYDVDEIEKLFLNEHTLSVQGTKRSERLNLQFCCVTFNRRTSSTPHSSALQNCKFSSF